MHKLYSLKPKKHFGQNFLEDDHYLDRIIESIPSNSEIRIIEIGVGLGDLTSRLLDYGNVLAFEIDKDLKPYLLNKFCNVLENGHLKIVFSDVLEIWKTQNSLYDKPYILVSNLPYYIATTIVLNALRDIHCKFLVVMTQKEVAEKFCAAEKTSLFSPLSIMVQSVGVSQWICDVPPEAFNPPPKVTSSVFSISKERQMILEPLEALLKVAFHAPRKKLYSNLIKQYDQGEVLKGFQILHLDENIRPHQLTTQHYHQLVKILIK